MVFAASASKPFRTPRFITRFAKYFKSKETLELLYSALVEPRAEYASAIWNPRAHIINLNNRKSSAQVPKVCCPDFKALSLL